MEIIAAFLFGSVFFGLMGFDLGRLHGKMRGLQSELVRAEAELDFLERMAKKFGVA